MIGGKRVVGGGGEDTKRKRPRKRSERQSAMHLCDFQTSQTESLGQETSYEAAASASQNNNNISTTYAKLNDVTDTLTSITLSFIMFHCNFILVLSLFITLLTKLGNNSD